MKKIVYSLFLLILCVLTLTSCGGLGNGNTSGNGGSNTGGGNNNQGNNDKKVLTVQEASKIKENIGSYSRSFVITTYDGVYNYDFKYNSKTSTGVVSLNGDEYFFSYGYDDEYVVYYENDYGYGYNINYELSLLNNRYLYDISSEIVENAKYASSEVVNYAGREAIKYVITDKDSMLPIIDQMDVTIDKETGAVLQVKYSNIDFYESTSFVPNDQTAEDYVNNKRKEVAFDFYDKSVLAYVGLGNINIPNWYIRSATFSYLDMENKTVENMGSYTIEYYFINSNPVGIEDLSKDIYNMGYKCDFDGVECKFEDLFDTSSATINYTVVDTVGINCYKMIDGNKFNVYFSGRRLSSEDTVWHVTLAVNRITD